MRDRTAIQERYMRDSLAIRLGGLAANLARIESFSDHHEHLEIVYELLDESKFFIEWTAPDTELEVQVELINLQRLLAQWQYRWTDIWVDPEQRSSISRQVGAWSKRILELSGFLR